MKGGVRKFRGILIGVVLGALPGLGLWGQDHKSDDPFSLPDDVLSPTKTYAPRVQDDPSFHFGVSFGMSMSPVNVVPLGYLPGQTVGYANSLYYAPGGNLSYVVRNNWIQVEVGLVIGPLPDATATSQWSSIALPSANSLPRVLTKQQQPSLGPSASLAFTLPGHIDLGLFRLGHALGTGAELVSQLAPRTTGAPFDIRIRPFYQGEFAFPMLMSLQFRVGLNYSPTSSYPFNTSIGSALYPNGKYPGTVGGKQVFEAEEAFAPFVALACVFTM